jgi:AcrR family transcriptional regulator
MPRRTKEDAAKTRQSLLIASRSVFSRKGYATTTLEEVAQEAGLTRGAIYWHFGSKAELYLALLDEYSGKSGEIIQAAAAQGGTLLEILARVFTCMLEAIETDPALREVMEISLFKTERTPDLVAALQRRRENTQALVQSIAAAMQQGIASGELRSDLDPLEMGRAFLAYQNGAIYLWLQDPAAFSLRASAPALADMYLNGIVARQ